MPSPPELILYTIPVASSFFTESLGVQSKQRMVALIRHVIPRDATYAQSLTKQWLGWATTALENCYLKRKDIESRWSVITMTTIPYCAFCALHHTHLSGYSLLGSVCMATWHFEAAVSHKWGFGQIYRNLVRWPYIFIVDLGYIQLFTYMDKTLVKYDLCIYLYIEK